jgi:glycosyltransferase involved in cell wall biosynthesis
MMPRILFVNRMATLVRGGGETFDLEISASLEKLGCQVSYLSGAPLWGSVPLPLRHARSHVIHSPYLPWFPWDKVKAGWRVRVWEFQQFERKAAQWIKAHADAYDVIQICELPYLVSLLKSSAAPCPVPLVLRLTAPNAHDPWGGIQLADEVIASGTSIEKVRKQVRPSVVDVPNAVDLGRFPNPVEARAETSFRAKYKIPAASPLFLYVARFQAFKNHRLLLEAFRQVLRVAPEAHLALAGSGPLQGEVMEFCRTCTMSERVHFLGEVPYADVPGVYAAADIKVISSEYESFCFAAIEAMAAGLPVVTTDCGWVPKLIGDPLHPIQKQWAHGGDAPGRFELEENGKRLRRAPGGLVVSRVEPDSLAQAMVCMMADADLRAACGAWNRTKAVREHGWESSAQKLLGVYEGLRSDVRGLKSDA